MHVFLSVYKNRRKKKAMNIKKKQVYTHVCMRKQIQNRTHTIVYIQNTSMIFNT